MNTLAKMQIKLIDLRITEMQIAFLHFIFDTVNERNQFGFHGKCLKLRSFYL